MENAQIVQKVNEYIQKYDRGQNEGLFLLEYRTGVWRNILKNIADGKHERYRISTLDCLYDFFHIDRDDFYMDNMERLKSQNVSGRKYGHESTFGMIMQEMRKRKKLTIDEVASALKVNEKTIRMIEYGVTLPNVGSYTLSKLLDFYDFCEEDRNTIQWMITISKDTYKILKRIQNPIT